MNPTEGLSASLRPESASRLGSPGGPRTGPGAGARGGAGCGQRGGGGEAPAAREVPGFRADFCVAGRLRHRPKARAGGRGRGRGAAGSPGVLTESTGPDFPAAVAVASLRSASPPPPGVAVPALAPAPSARGPRRSPGKRAGAVSGAERGRPPRASLLAASAAKRGFLGPALGPSGSPPSWPRRRASRFPREEKKSWHCGSLPRFFPPRPPARLAPLHNSCRGIAA